MISSPPVSGKRWARFSSFRWWEDAVIFLSFFVFFPLENKMGGLIPLLIQILDLMFVNWCSPPGLSDEVYHCCFWQYRSCRRTVPAVGFGRMYFFNQEEHGREGSGNSNYFRVCIVDHSSSGALLSCNSITDSIWRHSKWCICCTSGPLRIIGFALWS